MKAERTIKNIVSAILLQIVTLALGFIIPRITLTNYGSETNGFMSLVTQIYSYIALLEAGLGTAVVQALYSPIAKDDKFEISGVINAAKNYYYKVSLYYTIAVSVVSIVLPFAVSANLSKTEIALYFGMFGISNIVNFLFTAAYKPILIAEGKNYVNSNIALIFHLILQWAKIALLLLGINIVLLQVVYSAINIIQVVVYFIYFKKNYKWINKKVSPLMSNIKQRSAFFIQQLTRLIFSCTDVMIISFFCDLKVASVYSVYMLVYTAIGTLLSNFTSSTQFILGQTYSEKKESYLKVHRAYETAIVCAAGIFYSAACFLTIPFMKLYTSGITDVNYIDILLPVLLSLNGILSTYKAASINLINFTYHAKNTVNRTIAEALINLLLTVSLVPFFGIRGALIGTTVALIYRVIDMLFYSNHKILKDSILKPLKLYIANLALFSSVAAIGFVWVVSINSYTEFILWGIVTVIIVALMYLVLNALLDIHQTKMIISIIKNKGEIHLC